MPRRIIGPGFDLFESFFERVALGASSELASGDTIVACKAAHLRTVAGTRRRVGSRRTTWRG